MIIYIYYERQLVCGVYGRVSVIACAASAA